MRLLYYVFFSISSRFNIETHTHINPQINFISHRESFILTSKGLYNLNNIGKSKFAKINVYLFYKLDQRNYFLF